MTDPVAPLADCGAPDTGRAIWLTAADGTRLRMAHWPGTRHVMILPGRTEYIEKYGLVVRDFVAAGWGAFVLDWRGQGLSDRLLSDPLIGHVARFFDYQRDLDAALQAADRLAPGPKPWLVHSMGGGIALRGLMRGKRPPAVAFSAPMLGLHQSHMLTKALRGLSALLGPLGLDTGYAPTTGPGYGLPSMTFDDNNLTTDRVQFDRMKAQITQTPALSLGGPSLHWMGEAAREIASLNALPSPDLPALFGLGGDESIVSPQAIRARVATWPKARLHDFPGAKHELMMERDAVRRAFLHEALALFDRTVP
ncbi:alpha/beta hydrolase [Pararhodobacter sp.]|uniref:alpha/beta hydrolase n=1 Tax=Pararhodobacter sp. TaxID=2127056 RepID=UPI002AFE47F9|nr:alpha/beta hydrolase [Pararhodobacter sp.]